MRHLTIALAMALGAVGAIIGGPAPTHAQTATSPAVTVPDWPGVWFPGEAAADISGFGPLPAVEETIPPAMMDKIPVPLVGGDVPWTAEGRRRVADMWANFAGRKSQGWGYPMMMAGNAPLEFLIAPGETLIINQYRDVRHIYTDGRPLPASEDRWPTVWGESVGHWEGDMLVIETVSVRDPVSYFFYSPPFSTSARYTERYRMTGPSRIEGEMTIEDPVTLERPWTVKLSFSRADGLDRLVHDDFTNDRSESENGGFSIRPPNDAAGKTGPP